MKKYSSPLNAIRIASPCSADWDEMYGDERKRFCQDCRFSVYNLSEMTSVQAETFLRMSEGRVCIKLYKRRDGTVMTKDCPVGFARVKRRVSRIGVAILSLVGGLAGGWGATKAHEAIVDLVTVENPQTSGESDDDRISFDISGIMTNLGEIKELLSKD